MAKKTKAKKRKSPVRRRVGATALNLKNPIVMYGPIVGGFLMGDMINNAIDKALPDDKVGQKIKGGAEAGIGAALVFMKLGKKKTIIEVVAGGVLAGAGVRRLLKEFGIITGIGGYQSVPVLGRRAGVNGYGAVPVIGNGYKTSRTALNGVLNGGYQVPQVPSKLNVMGSTGSGSGLNNSGSDCMQ
jgi:hypothetical protein